ncbi:MAG: pumilio domain member 6 [Vezdaea aestivalis]|nr:MAG: pumilio domain member 6 [Vezdaea aestivalis]
MASTKRKSSDLTSAARKKPKSTKQTKVDIRQKSPHSSGIDSESEGSFGGFSDGDDVDSADDGGVPLKAAKQKALSTNQKESRGSEPTQNGNGASTSKEARAKQKAVAQERKAAKPNANYIQQSKAVWEKLRRKTNVSKEDRAKLVAELYEIVKGRMKDLIFKHDGGRSIQCAIKWANPDQRRSMALELRGSYVELAKGTYSKHFIDKLLVHGDTETRDLIIPEFYGQVRALLRHPDASWVMDDIYRAVASADQKALLLREWYSPQYAQENQSNPSPQTSDLRAIFAAAPETRPATMRFLSESITKLIETQRTAFTILHDAMLQYFLALPAGSDSLRAFIDLVRGDDDATSRTLIRTLGFSYSGARILSYVLAHGTAKDRKVLLRAFRAYPEDDSPSLFPTLATHKSGYLVLLAAFDTVDDTVQIPKMIFTDLFGKENYAEQIIPLALDPVGKLVLADLLAPPPPDGGRPASAFANPKDAEVLREVALRRVETSKKDPSLRRAELRRAASAALIAGVEGDAKELLHGKGGARFVVDVVLRAEGDKQAAMEAVAAAVEGDPKAEDFMGFNKFAVAKMLNTLIAGGEFDKEKGEIISKTISPSRKSLRLTQTTEVEPLLAFANVLFPHIREHLVDWATSKSSFVVYNMLTTDEFTQKTKALKSLEKARTELAKVGESGNAGAKKILDLL